MHDPNKTWCGFKSLGIEIHLDPAEYLQKLVRCQFTSGVNCVSNRIGGLTRNLQHALRLLLPYSLRKVQQLLLNRLNVKLSHLIPTDRKLEPGLVTVDRRLRTVILMIFPTLPSCWRKVATP